GEHGWDGLARAQRKYLADFWSRADVELEGDDEVQQGIRFAMFHVLQAAARAEQRAIPAKGLTGPGYDGHTFWDTETFVLPVLTYTAPETVPDALRWRHSILDGARQRASDLGLNGAAFPWRTIHGEECSGYWPASTAAFHINADIADAVLRYMSATEDVAFQRKFGAEVLGETARAAAPLHAPHALTLRAHPPRPVPAVPPLLLLRAVPKTGHQAGRPRARDAPARRRVHR